MCNMISKVQILWVSKCRTGNGVKLTNNDNQSTWANQNGVNGTPGVRVQWIPYSS